MGHIKQLAGQTAIYGIPSILGRLINYLLVFVHTRFLTQSEYGVNTFMYAMAAMLFVVLTYGMETAFFRYVNLEKGNKKIFGTAFLSILFTSSLFLGIVYFFLGDIASLIKVPGNPEYVVVFAWILALDAITAIPYAKLRIENRARKFAFFRTLNIFINVVFNLFFIFILPKIYSNAGADTQEWMSTWYSGRFTIMQIFVSNLAASVIQAMLLSFIILKEKLTFDTVVWKKMIRYALPLLFFGLAGIVNQTIDRAMLRYLLPESVAEAQLGIYGACYKISIIMSLFIQAFRYAAEPFFFSKASVEDSRKLFAGVMNIFVLITGVIFLITMLFLDDLFILFVGSDFRGGVDVVPILLYAFMFLGISYNLSIWYKLTNRTMFGAWLATGGAVITVAINYWFIPQYAYMASAWATFISNAVIMIASFIIGQRYFTVPYNIQKILLYLVLPFVVYYFAVLLRFENGTYRILFRSFVFLAYLFLVYLIERKNLKILIKQ